MSFQLPQWLQQQRPRQRSQQPLRQRAQQRLPQPPQKSSQRSQQPKLFKSTLIILSVGLVIVIVAGIAVFNLLTVKPVVEAAKNDSADSSALSTDPSDENASEPNPSALQEKTQPGNDQAANQENNTTKANDSANGTTTPASTGNKRFADLVPPGAEHVASEVVIRQRLGISFPGMDYLSSSNDFYILDKQKALCFYYSNGVRLSAVAQKTGSYVDLHGEKQYSIAVTSFIDGDTATEEELLDYQNGTLMVGRGNSSGQNDIELHIFVNADQSACVAFYNPTAGVSCAISADKVSDPNYLVQIAEELITCQNQ